ncbi:hypothetical protein H6P81_002595 [Aristolochia fimbriata]|uniref:F-box/LRR-repeat protein 15-like leucin rich repeat domain-containing protein n=1 Tax=Aristolochia fimbriata TaxID=158543 RepID=A0AAV7FEB1_ARIFI|nr:hypothetical protein H6P81_002595 [Aristolochia fimbriata]
MDQNLSPQKSDPEPETGGSGFGCAANSAPRRRSLRLSAKSGSPVAGAAAILVEPSRGDGDSSKNAAHKSVVKSLAGTGGSGNGGNKGPGSLEMNEEGKISRKRFRSVSPSSDEKPRALGSLELLNSPTREIDTRKDTTVEVEESPVSGSGKLRRKFERLAGVSTLSPVPEVDFDRTLLNLRSGRAIVRKRVDDVDVREASGAKVVEKSFVSKESEGDALADDVNNQQQEKGICMSEMLVDNVVCLDSDSDSTIGGSCSVHNTRRYSKEAKGKSKLVDENLAYNEIVLNRPIMLEEETQLAAEVKQSEVSSEGHLIGESVQDNPQMEDRVNQKNQYANARERFRGMARAHASRFAYFNPDEEGQHSTVPVDSGALDVEDWPGPFSTAMKIIKDREAKLNSRQERSTGDSNNLGPPIEWTPSDNTGHMNINRPVPSLASKCLLVLCEYAEQIFSLEGVPEFLRSKLCQALCNSRKMDSRLLDLLIVGSPSEISVKDCSSITEEKLKQILARCETTKLEVVQLDLSGRCVSDYLLSDTLASVPNNLPALISVSLKGACRLTDNGLKSLVNAAPLLSSINLSQCSLLSSAAISIISDTLGSVLKKLYIDDCQGIDAMSCIPSLKRLTSLEVLSVARVLNVGDKFIYELVSARGLNIRELGLADCGNLTDTSVKIIAERCPLLHAVDLSNLQKLTDSSLRCIADNCRELQILRLRHNAFSDEAVAAFLEAGGGSLKELSLNSVKEVANRTAKAIASRCSSTLQILDLSFCRKLKNEALGLIVDTCSSLRLLKLFGCTQVTSTFLDGHSNSFVSIVGVKASPILERMELLQLF